MVRSAVLLGALGILGANGANAAPKRPAVKLVLVDTSAEQETTLLADAVGKKVIASYGDAIRRCHAAVSDLSGTLELRFVITEAGKVGDNDAISFDGPFEDCVRAAMTKWSFARPRLAGVPTTSRYTLVLALDSTGRTNREIVDALHADTLLGESAQESDNAREGADLADAKATAAPVEGPLKLDAVRAALLPGVRRCVNRSPSGALPQLSLAFDVDAGGHATNIHVRGAYRRVRACVTSHVARLAFPAAGDTPVHLDVPFTQ